MQNTHILGCFKLTVILLLCSLSTIPQDATGTIKGTVKDSMGAVIPGAKLVFEPKTSGRPITVSSDAQGEFEVIGVMPGAYQIDFEFFRMAYRNDNITVRPSEITKLDVTVSYEAICPVGAKGETLQLSDNDRTEIVSSILADALVSNFISDRHGLLKEQKGPIVLSLETIKSEWVKKPTGINLVLMSEKQVREKANRGGDYLYLSFSEWHFGESCVVVTLNNSWAVADDSPWGYLSGGGRTYVYKKENGKWIGRSIGGWIS